ncbi:MAG: hypothetical protein JNL74_03240 [Fibrobacteres bacterium]|nr:hypothetical protein [Fibrobacterota bacterium]
MLSKLTLSVDDAVVAGAKSYAHKNKLSLSKVVEIYLNSLTATESDSTHKLPPITKSLLGIAKSKAVPDDYKKSLVDALTERHL